MATIKKGLAARIAAGTGAVALATLISLGGALPASAAPDNIDTDEVGSITIHKFAEPATASGLANDGSLVDTTGLTPLEGVTFTVERVGDYDMTTNADWQAAYALTVAQAQAGTLTAVGSATTNAAGTAFFGALDLGVYLVTESAIGDNNVVIEAAPFLVTVPIPIDDVWEYDVHVYPKNSLTEISKTYTPGTGLGLGSAGTWTITADVPEIASDDELESFVIADTLDARLTYVGATVTGTGVALVAADYEVTAGPAFAVTFTEAGLLKLAAADDAQVQVVITTNITGLGDGTIENVADVTINGTAYTSGEAVSNWGTIAILKYEARADATDMTGVLQGAEFQVFASAADAAARTNPITVSGATTFTSGENGIAWVPGLQAGVQYWVVETKSPVGYVLDTTPQVFTAVTGDVAVDSVDLAFANDQVPTYALPITGGEGQAAFMIGGAGLLLGALGFALMRRRKAQAEA